MKSALILASAVCLDVSSASQIRGHAQENLANEDGVALKITGRCPNPQNSTQYYLDMAEQELAGQQGGLPSFLAVAHQAQWLPRGEAAYKLPSTSRATWDIPSRTDSTWTQGSEPKEWEPPMNIKNYYDCSKVLHTAWAEHGRRPCGTNAHAAAECMKNNADACTKLREGGNYLCSYQALLRETDSQCGGAEEEPVCQPPCQAGIACTRDGFFPFEPLCVGGNSDVTLNAAVPPAPKRSGARALSSATGAIALLVLAAMKA
jgi:hypothetical protein